MAERDRASDSASKKAHGAHGKGRGQEEDLAGEETQNDASRKTGQGEDGWGDQASGGSTVDKRKGKK